MAAAVPALVLLLHALGAAANVTYCWGSGSTGQLGDGQGGGAYTQAVPTAVSNAPEFAVVQAGAQHTCGVTAAGQAYCWGQALDGQLGTGNSSATAAYLAVPTPVAGSCSFTGLALGEAFTCGIADDKAFCWGSGESGRLGTGRNDSSGVPLQVAGNHNFTSISLGQAHACALTPEGQAWCWGENFFGQLGDNSTTSSNVPVQVATSEAFASITAGSQHTCALLAASREAVCWGNNADGQLGSNETVMATTPVWVKPVPGGSFASLAAGAMFTCGNIINSANYATYCWGQNSRGQLGGEPAYDFPKVPVKIPGTQLFASITAGGAHACGVGDQAMAYCWGDGADGQLGTGAQGSVNQYAKYFSTTPLPVAQEGGSTIPFYLVSAGGKHTCGVSSRAAPAASPSAAPSPGAEGTGTPSPPPPPSSSSSFPVGAVVGAVVGAAAVAVLAFLAFRPRKGWLRKRRSAALEFDAEGGLKGSSKELSPADDKDDLNSPAIGELDSFLTKQSYASQPAAAHAGAQSVGSSGSVAKAANSFGTASDPLLLYISSYLASQPVGSTTQLPHPHLDSNGSGSGVSSSNGTAQALSPETHMWQLQWDELAIERAIGRGSFGAVYRARWQETTVAVKVLIDRDRMSHNGGLELPDELMRALDEEAGVMIRMRHPNVVQFMGLCQVPPAIVTEYCARGSLYSCLQSARTDPAAAAELTWARRLSMATDAATGLLYLHMRDILHRDVKSPNYLVDQHWGVKVSDLNLSRLLGDNGLAVSSAGPANPVWLAPELLRGGRASTASDVFSFGVVLWELLTWRLPWAGSGLTPFQIGAKVVAGERLELPPREALPGPDTGTFAGLDAYCALIQECWAAQPEQRPGMAQVVRRLRGLLEQHSSTAAQRRGRQAAAAECSSCMPAGWAH